MAVLYVSLHLQGIKYYHCYRLFKCLKQYLER